MLTHFWTLAIEEQFYLFWPLLVYRLSRRALAAICIAMVPLQLLLRILPYTVSMDAKYGNFSYRLTPFHSEGLFVGALLAICMSARVMEFSHLLMARWLAAGSFVALALTLSDRFSPILWVSRATISFVAIFSGALIAILILNSTGWLSRCFALKPLAIVGRYSYCMYVIHLVVISHVHNVERFISPGKPLGFLFSGSALYLFTFLVAAISWRLVEEPLLGLKWFFMYQTKDVAAPAPLAPRVTVER